jgi:hypothetical protein
VTGLLAPFVIVALLLLLLLLLAACALLEIHSNEKCKIRRRFT